MALNLNFPQGRIGRLGLISLVLFILTIPLGNWVVTNVGLVCDPHGPILGNLWAVAAIAAGALLSYLLADPAVVLGSTAAFLFSELADFAVYTPMRRRFPSSAVVVSGLVGSVVDSMIFLSLAFGSLDYLFGQVLGKFWMSLLGGAVLWYIRYRQHRAEPAADAVAI